jgi:hypothetical protein
MQFHDVELAAEARREVASRIAIYDKWVIEGRLTPELAERRIAMMRAIAERLEMGVPMHQSAAAHIAEKIK